MKAVIWHFTDQNEAMTSAILLLELSGVFKGLEM